MKKISLLLITLLMATSAYSGGDGDPADGHDAVYDGFVVLGEEEERADQCELEQLEDAAAVYRVEIAADEVPIPGARVVPSFDICARLRLALDGAAQTVVGGVQEQWQRVPTVECPCVKRRMHMLSKWHKEMTGDVVTSVGKWCDARRKDAPEAGGDAAEIACLKRELREKEELLRVVQAELLTEKP